MRNLSIIIGMLCLGSVLYFVETPSAVAAAVEPASWGEIKAGAENYRAGKALSHRGTPGRTPSAEDITGDSSLTWGSRRFEVEADGTVLAVESVTYVFSKDGTVMFTFSRTVTDGEAEVVPLNGRWSYFGEQGTMQIDWEGDQEQSNWASIRLHLHRVGDGEEEFVLDYREAGDKELRTLTRMAPPPPPPPRGLENWIVLLDPDRSSIRVNHGEWVGVDFEVLAAEGHLPRHVIVHIPDSPRSRDYPLVYALDKRAYTGSDDVPKSDLCYSSPPGREWWTAGDLPIGLINERLEDREISGTTVTNVTVGDGGFFLTGCGSTSDSRVQIFSPDANVETDRPLKEFLLDVR